MKKYTPYILIVLYFFTFTIGQVLGAWDRSGPQFLFLSAINIISFVYLFNSKSISFLINQIKENKYVLCYTLFVLVSGLSIIVADNKIEALIVFSELLTFFFVFISLYTISLDLKKKFVDFIIALTFISLIIEIYPSLSLFYENAFLDSNAFFRSNDYKGFSGNINISAFSIIYKVPLLFYLIFKYKSYYLNLLFSLILFFSTTVLIILLSRGAVLALIFSIILLVLFSLYSKKRVYLLKSIFISFVCISSYMSTTNYIQSLNGENIFNDRMQTLNKGQEDESIAQRSRYFKASLQSIINYPILGVGIGNWKIESIKYDAYKMTEYYVPFYVHNDFLQIGAEIGIIGLLFFVLFIIGSLLEVFKKIIKNDDLLISIFLFISLSNYVIDAMINFPTFRPISHIYLLFLVCMIYTSMKKKLNEIS